MKTTGSRLPSVSPLSTASATTTTVIQRNPTAAVSTTMAQRGSLFSRGGGGGRGGGGRAGGGAGDYATGSSVEELQRENDAILGALSSDMTRLRQAASTLRDEAHEHNKLLDGLQNGLQFARDGVVTVTGKVGDVLDRHGMRHTVLCAFSLFGLMVLAYYTWQRSSRSSASVASPQ